MIVPVLSCGLCSSLAMVYTIDLSLFSSSRLTVASAVAGTELVTRCVMAIIVDSAIIILDCLLLQFLAVYAIIDISPVSMMLHVPFH